MKACSLLIIFFFFIIHSIFSQPPRTLKTDSRKGIVESKYYKGKVKTVIKYDFMLGKYIDSLLIKGFSKKQIYDDITKKKKEKIHTYNREGQLLTEKNISYLFDEEGMKILNIKSAKNDPSMTLAFTEYFYNTSYTESESYAYEIWDKDTVLIDEVKTKVLDNGFIEEQHFNFIGKERKRTPRITRTWNADDSFMILERFGNKKYAKRRTELTYNENGYQIKNILFVGEQKTPRRETHSKFSESGDFRDILQKVSYSWGADTPTTEETCECNDQKNVIKCLWVDFSVGKKKEHSKKYEYLYDKKGNWILRLSWIDDIPSIAEFRTIEYWD